MWRVSACVLVTTVLLGVMLAPPGVAPTATAAAAAVPFGIVLVGPRNDHGWSEAHYIGAQYAERHVPGAKMIYVDNVNPAAKPGVTVP